MDSYRLKMKIGNAEFEAEGPVEIVQAQFAAFKEMIERAPVPVATESERKESAVPTGEGTLTLDKIMKAEGRLISLTAHSNSVEDAVLLVILGQKMLRSNESITGGEILDGLKQSGHVLNRVDRILEKFSNEGLLIKVGTGRGSRYRLTNQGLTKGQEVARGVIALVA